MKGFFALLCCTLMLTACSASKSKEVCLKIYEEGTQKIQQAQSQQEISDISYEVAKKIVEVTEGPNGEENISASEETELRNAQQKFYRAIESRARELIPTQQPAKVEDPIMRTSVK